MNPQRDTSSFRLQESISLQQTGFTTSVRHRKELWAFTPLISPLPGFLCRRPGGFVSVALSLGSPPVAVSNCPSLRCPDFPPGYRFRWPGDQPIIWQEILYTLSACSFSVQSSIDFSVSQFVEFSRNVLISNLFKLFG